MISSFLGEETGMESQRVLEKTPPPPPVPATLRTLLEKKTEELERRDLGVWVAGICGPI
jgi:hypothetical protein